MKNIRKYIIRTKIYDENYELIPILEHYNNGNIAITLYEFKSGEEFAVITKNIPMASSPLENVAFVDVNNYSWIEKLLIKHKLAKPTGHITQSGYCRYPEYEFNMAKVYS